MKKAKIKLFGRKKSKKYSFKDTFQSKFSESIKFYEYRDHEPETVDNRYDGVPFLPRRHFNSSIPTELLSKLPFHLQKCWDRIDLEEYFKEPKPPIPPIPPEIMGMTEKPIDILKMVSENKKAKIKAMVLGELDDETLNQMKKKD